MVVATGKTRVPTQASAAGPTVARSPRRNPRVDGAGGAAPGRKAPRSPNKSSSKGSACPMAPSALGRYQRVRELGRGSYGSVSLVRRRSDRKLLAMKSVLLPPLASQDEKDFALRQQALREAEVLKELDSPHVVRYFCTILAPISAAQPRAELHIVTEYCNAGDLSVHLRKKGKGGGLPEKNVWRFATAILEGLGELHGRQILHRDLKLANVFLKRVKVERPTLLGKGSAAASVLRSPPKTARTALKRDGLEVKLGDLGLARFLSESQPLASTMVGTPHYCAPEMFEGQLYSDKADVYSFGVCVYELMHGRTPHADVENIAALVVRVLRLEGLDGTPRAPQELDSRYSPELRGMVDLCMRPCPEERSSTEELLCRARASLMGATQNAAAAPPVEEATSPAAAAEGDSVVPAAATAAPAAKKQPGFHGLAFRPPPRSMSREQARNGCPTGQVARELPAGNSCSPWENAGNGRNDEAPALGSAQKSDVASEPPALRETPESLSEAAASVSTLAAVSISAEQPSLEMEGSATLLPVQPREVWDEAAMKSGVAKDWEATAKLAAFALLEASAEASALEETAKPDASCAHIVDEEEEGGGDYAARQEPKPPATALSPTPPSATKDAWQKAEESSTRTSPTKAVAITKSSDLPPPLRTPEVPACAPSVAAPQMPTPPSSARGVAAQPHSRQTNVSSSSSAAPRPLERRTAGAASAAPTPGARLEECMSRWQREKRGIRAPSQGSQRPGTPGKLRANTPGAPRPGTPSGQQPGSARGQRPGSAGAQRLGSAGEQRPGSADEQRPGSAGGQRPGSAGGENRSRSLLDQELVLEIRGSPAPRIHGAVKAR